MSELQFDGEGTLKDYHDYCHASQQFYTRLAIIGWFLKRIRLLA